MLIDTHCHIHDPEYNFDAKAVIARSHYNKVDKIITIGTSPSDNQTAKTFANSFSSSCAPSQKAVAGPTVYWTYGYHPSEYHGQDLTLENLNSLADDKLVAVGEVGLDYHYQPYDRKQQIKLFEQMLELAKIKDLPLVFHVREAFADFWPIVDNANIKKAVMHSFSDSQANLEESLKRGYFIGVNGLATFAPIPLPPLERMILETDAPYLTPKPFRGKINEPSYVKNIAEWVADKYQVPFETVADTTTKNAITLFNI